MSVAADGKQSVTIQVVLPPNLHEWLIERSEQKGVPKSTFVRMALIELRRNEAT